MASAISGDRSEKHPLIHRQRMFAVRHRLLLDSPASPYGPFMVELFVAAGFASGPRRSHVRSGRSPGSELPTPAEVERTILALRHPGPNPLDGICTRFGPRRPRGKKLPPGCSASPHLRNHRVERRDYSGFRCATEVQSQRHAATRRQNERREPGLLRRAPVEPDKR